MSVVTIEISINEKPCSDARLRSACRRANARRRSIFDVAEKTKGSQPAPTEAKARSVPLENTFIEKALKQRHIEIAPNKRIEYKQTASQRQKESRKAHEILLETTVPEAYASKKESARGEESTREKNQPARKINPRNANSKPA
jgi:hypothetical protein